MRFAHTLCASELCCVFNFTVMMYKRIHSVFKGFKFASELFEHNRLSVESKNLRPDFAGLIWRTNRRLIGIYGFDLDNLLTNLAHKQRSHGPIRLRECETLN